MLTINKLDRTKGLDLILHTPGGDIAATESLVDYLYSMYGKDIRVIVPQDFDVCRNHDSFLLQGNSDETFKLGPN